jgi:hypothetical protein
MKELTIFFQTLYKHFNERKIELVIESLIDDVQWANGMEGGYVYGHEGVRNYWTRQFTMIKPTVTPLEINVEDGKAKVKVHQVVYDLNGDLLVDTIVYHFFFLKENKIERFEIGDESGNLFDETSLSKVIP